MLSFLTCKCGGEDVVRNDRNFRRMVEGSKYVSKDLRRAIKHGKLLGRGLTASVYSIVLNDEVLALKIIDKRVKLTKSVKKSLQHEVRLLRHLQRVRSGHRNLCNFHRVYEDSKNLYLALELCQGGELFDYIVNNSKHHFSEKEVAMLITQIARGLKTLHMAGVVHRDLKPENVVLKYDAKKKTFPSNSLKIMDFGFSLLNGEGCEGKKSQLMVVGSPQYMAPEICKAYFDGTTVAFSRREKKT